MDGNKARWRELCQQAETEQDPEMLAKLIEEINSLLDAKQVRVKSKLPPKSPNGN